MFHSNSKMGCIRYSEYIFWLSREIRFIHLHNDFGEEYIHSLYHGLRCNEKGVNIAGVHKDSFISLCKNILENPQIGDMNTYIDESFRSMEKEKKQTGIRIPHDRNMFLYLIIVIFHFVGCVCVSWGNLRDFGGNLFLAIPSDVLAILIYKGYVRERELKEESEMDKERDKQSAV